MVSGDPEPQQSSRRNVLCNSYQRVDAPVSGMLYSDVAPADFVQVGEVLGIFRGFGGEELAILVRIADKEIQYCSFVSAHAGLPLLVYRH